MSFRSVKITPIAKTALVDANVYMHNPENVSAFSDTEAIASRRKQLGEYIHILQGDIDALMSKNIPSPSIADVIRLVRGSHRKEINSYLTPLHTTICALKSQYNGLSPIARLPPEVLCQVFAYCATDSQDLFTVGIAFPRMNIAYLSANSVDWIKVTHVCHQWRSIALADPSLWNLISPSFPQWAIEMLSRSNPSPLIVRVDFFNLSLEGKIASEVILGQLWRIRELALIIPELTLGPVLSQPAPLLRSLTIRFFSRIRAVSLPGSLFAQTAPLLSYMSLDTCYLPWDSPLTKGLTHLRLVNVEIDIDMSQFLATLGEIPGLQELSLRDAIPSLPYNDMILPLPRTPTILHRLSSLHLHGPANDCANLLNNLHLPLSPVLMLNFGLRLWDINSIPIHGIISAVARHCGDPEANEKSLRGFSIETVSIGLRVQGWSSADIFQPGAPRRITLFLTSQVLKWPPKLSARAAMDVCSLFPLRHLRTLHWGDLNVSSVWNSARHYLSGVEKVFLDGMSVHGWLLAFATDGPTNVGAANIGTDSMPAIHTLIIRNASFGVNTTKKTNMRRLLDVLNYRRRLGPAIKILHLLECYGFTIEDVTLLKEIVPEVFWAQGPERIKDHGTPLLQ